MRSVSVKIPGEYWDSQIYSGELIIFDDSGALHRISWREIIDELAETNSSVQTAIRVAFSDSDLFYNQKVRKILFDPAISQPIKNQLKDLAELEIPHIRRSRHWKIEESPFEFLSTDTDIYYGQIFACGDEGLFSSSKSNIGAARSHREKVHKYHDASFLQIRASDSHTAIAAAAGDDGLFEFAYRKNDDGFLSSGTNLSKRSCSACDWSFHSVMAWSQAGAFLASFREESSAKDKKKIRSFDRIVNVQEMFGDRTGDLSGFSWGSREKIYRFSADGIEIANYSPAKIAGPKSSKNQYQQSFNKVHTEKFGQDFESGSPIATATAPFGTILEFDDHIIVLRSDGKIDKFQGEAVHWRVFPRSEHYSNHLHIVYDDHILIVSFIHDYFVDQADKFFGFARNSTKNFDRGEDWSLF